MFSCEWHWMKSICSCFNERTKYEFIHFFLSLFRDWRWRLIRTMTIETCPETEGGYTSIFWTNNHIIFSRCSYLILCVYDVRKYNVYEVYRQICTLFFFPPPHSLYYARKKNICVISITKTKKIIGSRNNDTNKW